MKAGKCILAILAIMIINTGCAKKEGEESRGILSAIQDRDNDIEYVYSGLAGWIGTTGIVIGENIEFYRYENGWERRPSSSDFTLPKGYKNMSLLGGKTRYDTDEFLLMFNLENKILNYYHDPYKEAWEKMDIEFILPEDYNGLIAFSFEDIILENTENKKELYVYSLNGNNNSFFLYETVQLEEEHEGVLNSNGKRIVILSGDKIIFYNHNEYENKGKKYKKYQYFTIPEEYMKHRNNFMQITSYGASTVVVGIENRIERFDESKDNYYQMELLENFTFELKR